MKPSPTTAATGSDDRADWRRFSDQMPVKKKWAYFDNAAVAPLPACAAEEVRRWLEEATCEGDTVWPHWARRTTQIREQMAGLIAARPEEIAFVGNTTAGIGLVAEGLDWRAGDNMVTLANEFPSNLFPWMNLASRDVEARLVAVDQGVPDWNRLREACDARTRLISVSWIGYASGYRLDVAQVSAIAKEVGALFFLDAIQGLGAFPLDVHQAGVDFLAADGHKWMVGPEGAGVFFATEAALAQLRPLGVGWNSVKNHGDYSHAVFDLRTEASRYEGGSPNMIGLHALGASLDLLASLGLGPQQSPIGQRLVELTDFACQHLVEAGAEIWSPRIDGHKSGIVVFRLPGVEPAAIRTAALEAGIVVSCRGGGVRISPHAYNDEVELQRLVELVAGLATT